LAGQMIKKIWCEIPQYYVGFHIDEFKIMPDHFHGIIFIYNETQVGQPQGVAPTLTLSDIVSRFKTLTTKLYTDGVKSSTFPPYNKRMWQRNFYEEIIRNEQALYEIRKYILCNDEN
jgi:putative transposase